MNNVNLRLRTDYQKAVDVIQELDDSKFEFTVSFEFTANTTSNIDYIIRLKKFHDVTLTMLIMKHSPYLQFTESNVNNNILHTTQFEATS